MQTAFSLARCSKELPQTSLPAWEGGDAPDVFGQVTHWCSHAFSGKVPASVDRKETTHGSAQQTKTHMKSWKLIGATLAVLSTQLIAAHAADLLLVNLRTTCKTFDGADRLISSRSSTATILRDYAAAQDPAPDVRNLRLVYDTEGDRIVIANTSGEVLADFIGFGSGVTVSNTVDTRRERHAFVFLGDDSEGTGSAIISERLTRNDENTITRQTVRGSFQYAEAAVGETPAQICTGTFSTGKKLVIQTPPPAPAPVPGS